LAVYIIYVIYVYIVGSRDSRSV